MPLGLAETYYRKLLDNKVFVISEERAIANGGTYNIAIENPSGSGKTVVFVDATTSGDGGHTSRVYDEFDSGPSGGTDIEIQAALLDSEGSDDDGIAIAKEEVSFSGPAATFGTIGGGKGANSIGGEKAHPVLAIEPGRTAVIEVENITTSEQTYTVSLIYFEKDGTA